MIIELDLFRSPCPNPSAGVHFITVPDDSLPFQSYSCTSLLDAAHFAAAEARVDGRDAMVRVTIGSDDSGRLARLATPGEARAAAVRLLVTYHSLKLLLRARVTRRFAARRLGRPTGR